LVGVVVVIKEGRWSLGTIKGGHFPSSIFPIVVLGPWVQVILEFLVFRPKNLYGVGLGALGSSCCSNSFSCKVL